MANSVTYSPYHPPWYLPNGHLQTLFPFWNDTQVSPPYESEQFELSDGDLVELDWIKKGSRKLLILCHGLEGNSRSHYIKQSAFHFSERGWDILAWNFRSCGRKLNRTPQFYHAGQTEDLKEIIEQVESSYDHLSICGFSIGATMAINYVAKYRPHLRLKSLIGFSVPLDFAETIQRLDRPMNRLYQQKFLQKLKRKTERKSEINPEISYLRNSQNIRSLRQFTKEIFAPAHGYGHSEFLLANSCLKALEEMTIPTLIVNAQNDPFLGIKSYPERILNSNVTLEYPKTGGHAGFLLSGKRGSWMECRAEAFLSKIKYYSKG